MMDSKEEYWKFVESERHFNTIQAGIRNRASTWLLAAFGAIAVLLKTGSGSTWLLPTTVLVGLVSFMATMGLVVLWINDQLVYQRLLNSVFLVGLKKEYDDPGLPPVRAMMMYSAEGKGMGRWMTYYYTIPMACFLGITFLVTIFHNKIILPVKGGTPVIIQPDQSLWILVVLCVIQVVATVWVQCKQSKVSPKERASLFGNNHFTEMFDGTGKGLKKFGDVVFKNSQDRKETESK